MTSGEVPGGEGGIPVREADGSKHKAERMLVSAIDLKRRWPLAPGGGQEGRGVHHALSSAEAAEGKATLSGRWLG